METFLDWIFAYYVRSLPLGGAALALDHHHRVTPTDGQVRRKPLGPKGFLSRPSSRVRRQRPLGSIILPRPGGHTSQSPRSAPSDGITLQGQPHRAPPTSPFNAPRPGGHASQSFPARRRGNKVKSVFSGDMRPGKNTSQPSSVRPPKGPCMQRAATPNFGRGHGPGRQPDTPASPASRTKRNRSSPLPKFKTPRFQPFSDEAARPGCWRCR